MSDPTPPTPGGAFLSPPVRRSSPVTPPQPRPQPSPYQKAPPLYLRRSLFFCSLFTYFPSPSRSIFASLIKAEVLYSTSTSVMPSVWISSVSEPR